MADSQDTIVGFAVTCRGRVQHLKQTLPANIANHAGDPHVRFIVLDYGSPDDLLPWILSAFPTEIESRRLVVATYPATQFAMAHAKNLSHRLAIQAGCSVLVNCDADNFVGPGFSHWIRKQFCENGPDVLLWSCMIQKCNELTDDELCILPRFHGGMHSADQQYLEGTVEENDRPLVRGISGRIAVSADNFIKLGGYDERYSAYGPDDKDFSTRAEYLGLIPHRIPSRFLDAIHHGPKLRFKEYPHAEEAADCHAQPIDINPHTAVVNFGNIGCGDILVHGATRVHTRINPVPTRIFGIGFQKTSTLSLAESLTRIGFDCAHWTSPRWARSVWEEMRAYGKSLTLEKHYAACDFPISTMYRELDRSYPGSKFILTIRDECDWLRSVRDHWNPEKNPWRASWDSDAFSHRMHIEVYGRKTFDAAIFLERYRRHNEEVRAYFRNRPQDLLIMDMDAGAGWAELCTFLDKPTPTIPFPRLNVS